MRVLKVIESKKWINNKTGRTASIYGSVPYTNELDKQDWSIQVVGWTWQCADGTIGLGRVPVKSYDEAIEIMNKVNSF